MFSEFSFSQKPPQDAAEPTATRLDVNELPPLPDNIAQQLEQSKWGKPPEPELRVGFLGEPEDKTPPVINNDGIAHEVATRGMVSLRVTHDVDPRGYPRNEFMASPSLTPPKARCSTPPPGRGSSQAGQVYVRLEAGEPKANPKDPDNLSDLVKRPHSLDISSALDGISTPQASIELFARPAPEELHREALLAARIRVSEGDKTATPRVEELKEHVVQTGILVSAPADKIDEVVSAVKRSLVDKGRSLNIVTPQESSSPESPQSEPTTTPMFFSSRDDALHHPGTTGSIRPTEQFADIISSAYPQKSVPGLEVGKAFDFAQEVGDPSDSGVLVGKVYDRFGKEIGPMVMPDSQGHVALVGNTGSGKSEALKKMISESARSGVPEIIVDLYKDGTYTRTLPGILAADNIPVRRIRPGGDGVLPVRLNVFGSDGNPETISRINNLLTGLVKGNEERSGAFGKWSRTSIDQQEERIGRQLYGEKAPPVQLEMIRQALSLAFEGSRYDQRVTTNMREFTTSQWDNVLSGNFGELFNKGYPLDIDKMLEPGVTVFELKGIGDPQQKIVATALLIFQIAETQRKRNGLQPTDQVQVRIRIDEGQDLTQTERYRIAFEFELLSRLVRDTGVELTLITQSLQGVDKSTLGQFTKNIIMRLGTGDDQLDAAKKLGITEQQAAFLGGFPGTEGRGWALASMNGKPPALTRFTLAQKTGEGVLKDAEDIADLGYYRKYYSREVIEEAEALLEKRQGALIRLLVEVNTLFILGGMAPPAITDEFKQQFTKLNEDVVQCAMDRAIHLATIARRDIASLEYGADEGTTPHQEFGNYMQMITSYQMRGENLTITIPELAWGANRYNDIARELGPPARSKDPSVPVFSYVSRYHQLRILEKEAYSILGAINSSFSKGEVEPHILERAAEFYGYKEESSGEESKKLSLFLENMGVFARLNRYPDSKRMQFFQKVQEQIEQRTPDSKHRAPVHLYMQVSAALEADKQYQNGAPVPAKDLSNLPNGELFSGATYLYQQTEKLLELMDQADSEFPISDINAIFAIDYAPGAIGTILDRILSILRPVRAAIVDEPGLSLIELHEQGRNPEIFKTLSAISNLADKYLSMDHEQRTYFDWTVEDGNARIAEFVKNRRPKIAGSKDDE